MFAVIRPACLILFVLTVLTGVVYPLVVWGVAQTVFRDRARGSLIVKDGVVRGSELIGQPFSDARYFHSRPSATARMPYDASASSGSNLGPTNPALADALKSRVETLRRSGVVGKLPVDLVTTSASGLDPHISPSSAYVQVERVARARGLAPERVRALVEGHVQGRTFGILGEATVNVLLVNMELDTLR